MQALRLLLLTALSLCTATCGSSESGFCPAASDSGLTCLDVCGDVEEFRRFPCQKAPFMMCDSRDEAARPLNKAQVDYVVEKCRTCTGCSKNCQSCNAGLPAF
jgi:hypothetical protein